MKTLISNHCIEGKVSCYHVMNNNYYQEQTSVIFMHCIMHSYYYTYTFLAMKYSVSHEQQILVLKLLKITATG